MNRIAILISLVMLFAISALGQSGAAGTWDVTLNSPQGTFNIQFILKQDGEQLTGVVKGQRGETALEGTLKAKDIVLKWTTKFQDNDLPITLNGVFDGNTMKGTADYGGFAQGDFSAKRAAEPTASPSPPAPNAGTAEKVDISGAWLFQVETSAGTGTPAFTFKQEGETLTGQYKGVFGEAPLTGTIKGNKVDFKITAKIQEQDVTINYTGTVEKDGTMKGTVSVGDLGSGTWTGKRQ